MSAAAAKHHKQQLFRRCWWFQSHTSETWKGCCRGIACDTGSSSIASGAVDFSQKSIHSHSYAFQRFCSQIRRRAGRRQVVSVPSGARLMAVAVSLPDLWRSRSRLVQVEGLNLELANRLLGVVGAESGDPEDIRSSPLPVLPYAVWQCGAGYEELSERVTLVTFDFNEPLRDREGEAVLAWKREDLPCSAWPSSGVNHNEGEGGGVRCCHAIVMWMDYFSGSGLLLSQAPDRDGGPTPHTQGVLLLPKRVAPLPSCCINLRATFSSENGDMEFRFCFK